MSWGGKLRDIGFPDLPAVGPGNEFSITFWPSPGVYHISWLDDYIPRDESGFGGESDYAFLWLDQLDQLREAYWQDPARRATERKYRHRLRISKELPWGRTLEEIAPLLGANISRA